MQATTTVRPVQERSSSMARALSKAAIYIVLITFSIVFLIPAIWLILTSLKQESQMFAWPPQWIPNPFWPRNYVQMFELVPMTRYLLNTLKILAFGVTGVGTSAQLFPEMPANPQVRSTRPPPGAAPAADQPTPADGQEAPTVAPSG